MKKIFLLSAVPLLLLSEGNKLCALAQVKIKRISNKHIDRKIEVFMEKNYRTSSKKAKRCEIDLEERFGNGKYEFEILGISCKKNICVAYTNEGIRHVGDYIEDAITPEEILDVDPKRVYAKKREKIYRITFRGIYLLSKTVEFKSKETRWK